MKHYLWEVRGRLIVPCWHAYTAQSTTTRWNMRRVVTTTIIRFHTQRCEQQCGRHSSALIYLNFDQDGYNVTSFVIIVAWMKISIFENRIQIDSCLGCLKAQTDTDTHRQTQTQTQTHTHTHTHTHTYTHTHMRARIDVGGFFGSQYLQFRLGMLVFAVHGNSFWWISIISFWWCHFREHIMISEQVSWDKQSSSVV